MNLIILIISLVILFIITVTFLVSMVEEGTSLNEVIIFIIIIIPITLAILNSASAEKAKNVFIDHTISTGQESGYEDLFECEFTLDIGTISKFDCYTEDRVSEGLISKVKRTDYTVIKTDSNYIITVN